MIQHFSIQRALLSGTTLLMTVALTTTAWAIDFAPSGAQGTLNFKVVAVGGARHKASPGAGLDARAWKINNSGEYTIRIRAIDATGDGSAENQEKAAQVRGTFRQTVTEKDQDVLDKWEEKADTCNGNEACENRVRGQMFADPQYQRIFQKMQGAAPVLLDKARAVNTGLRTQIWTSDPIDPLPGNGALRIDVEETNYGVIDTGGGGKVDVTCRWNGSQKITPGSPESKLGATLIVDGKTSTYQIRIPADALGMKLTESCRDSKSGSHGPSKNMRTMKIIGSTPGRGVKDFNQVLSFKGPLGSVRSPQMSGKTTVTTDWIDSKNPQLVPVKVSIEWSFSAGGR
jgi:hypothetical protein